MDNEDFEIIDSHRRIEILETDLKQKKIEITDLKANLSELGNEITEKLKLLDERVNIIENENSIMSKQEIKEAYLSDLIELKSFLKNLLFFKESLDK